MANAFQMGDPDKCYELNKKLMSVIRKIESYGGSYSTTGYQSGASDFWTALNNDERYWNDQCKMIASDSEGKNACMLDWMVSMAVAYQAGDPDNCYELN